ncbi:MAG: OmpA family protein [Kofleriaceae bacterium]
MARASKGQPTDTGIILSDRQKLPVPTGRRSEPKMPGAVKNAMTKTYAALAGGSLVAGIALGFVLRPAVAPDARIAKLEKSSTEATKAASVQKERADTLAKELDATAEQKKTIETELERAKKEQAKLADKAAANDKEMAKLKTAVDKAGSVSSDGDEITLQLVDKVLFKVGDDQLTDRGKAVLAKVATALKELPDKQIWVQGHTDDTPIYVPPPPPKKKPKAKGKEEPPPAPKFATNWELSAARALTVVHYLQDTAKLDPSRLAALAFGEYRPVSKSNKALNRRIEIVLYPHRARIRK